MKKKDELGSLVAEVAALPRTTAGHRNYPASLRVTLLAAKVRYMASGGSARDFAERLDIHSATLSYWAQGGRSKKKSLRVRAVRLSDETARPAPVSAAVVVLPSGARIEGLTTSQLIEIARGGV